ncbi:arabinan endo-1,5-alpha-L-arabinosidase [Undibacterium sp. Di26W]|uniref:arabinan endo-1,5-alpha-L-arabinosidase n=1 Tax=Undibacterium sp. Di26W TaxID=3413035 RepID=UPI003BF073EC
MKHHGLCSRRRSASFLGRAFCGIGMLVCAALTACGGGTASQLSVPAADLTGPLAKNNLTGAVTLIHDPAIIRQGDTWYVYSTDAPVSQRGVIPIRCSKDKVAYTDCGFVFPAMPSWIASTVPGATMIWAPDISYFGGSYHMYYAASVMGLNTSAIGVATNSTLDPTDPVYKWVDHGPILTSNSSSNFNAIDPNILVDSDGKVWLNFGSFWGGIFQHEIDAATGMVKASSTIRNIARRASTVLYDPVEGASMIHAGSYYYLFVSWDSCCDANPANSNYKIVVGRGTSPNGPFYDKDGKDMLLGGGTILLLGNSQWSGPGGQTAYVDPGDATHKAASLITFHALNLSRNGLDYLFVNSLDFTSGWPEIVP